jgi:hypothetical protein
MRWPIAKHAQISDILFIDPALVTHLDLNKREN